MVASCVYYFFGDWRRAFLYEGETYDWSRSRNSPWAFPWFDSYREGLALALCLGDESSTDHLLEWPGRDLCFDEGSSEMTRADNAYQIWLASRLRGESAESTADLLETVVASKRKRPRLLATTAQALLAGDSAEFTRSLTAYLRHYRTNELDTRLIITAMSSEGTALWHLARRKGLDVGAIPEDLMLLIPRP